MQKIETTYKEFFEIVKNNPEKRYYVKNHKETYSEILAAVEKESEMLYIELGGKYKIHCSIEHGFMNKNGEEILAKELKIHTKIQTLDGLLPVTSIKKSKETECYDISINYPHWYVNDETGIIHHNTILALFLVAAYLKKYPEAIMLYYDNEKGSTKSYFESVGIDEDRVIYIPVQYVEEMTNDIVDRLKDVERGDKVIIFVDSIGSMPTLGEIQKAEDGKTTADMGKRAQVIKSFLRLINSQIYVKDLPAIVISHKYKTMDLFPQDVISGGSSITLFAQNILILSKSQIKGKIKTPEGKIIEELIGYEYTININKSRFAKEKARLKFDLLWNEGLQKYSGLLELAIESGHVNRNSAQSFSKIDQLTGEIEDKKWKRKETNSKLFWNDILEDEKFKSFIEKKYALSSELLISDDDIEDVLEQVVIDE